MSDPSQPDPNTAGPDTSGMAMAQGDLAVNLFIVLLVVLSVLTVAKVSSSSEGYLTPYQRGETATATSAPVLGWQPVLPAYPKLVLRNKVVHLLDLTGFANAFAAAAPMDLGADVQDSSKMLPGHLDPSSYQMFLRLYDDTGFPTTLSAASVPLDQLNAEDGIAFFEALGDVPKLDLFAFPDGVADMKPLVDAVHARQIGARIIVMPRQNIFGFVHSGRDFGLERTFK